LGNHKKVLVVDDAAHIRRVIELKLKTLGYQVTLAKNGEDGFNLIQTLHPDVVITDIMMPKLDGKTLCERTNALKKIRPFLTIVITARISPTERDWIEQMQDTMLIEKPFSLSTIVSSIEKYLVKQR
jgi:CheY-like chemotaxis protein